MSSYPAGFTPVPRDPSQLPYAKLNPPAASISLADVPLPTSKLIEEAKTFLEPELGEKIWNHSHRAFLIGSAVAKLQFATDGTLANAYDAESFYLACLFHDIGCTPANIKKTELSFEFWGGLTTRQWLLDHGASSDLADSASEAIFRHTDFNNGKISFNGQLIQIGTLFDNVHEHAHLLPESFVAELMEAYPRHEWGGCFKGAMESEVEHKPWSHASELKETGAAAWDRILGNALEKTYA
ncbi:cyanamide hydratase [Punctularia strigosozonata HHB-11173 SS5]|uniref:Cyanamide hydratase n=1 Tax=Punctularia strigosozonata (strain HHB-11173) TaxID=741275 RepID=R7S4G2_PUNST|nr:cyanamide hydratase [Punctularia strigosozonata HHB-11173 SS5]EIN05260.1 cyanamide hydratase [Punctularia strigosozonata HHB-11173 SS5]